MIEILNRSPVLVIVLRMPDVVDLVVNPSAILTFDWRQWDAIVVLARRRSEVVAVPLLGIERHHGRVQQNAQTFDATLLGGMSSRYAGPKELENVILVGHPKFRTDSHDEELPTSNADAHRDSLLQAAVHHVDCVVNDRVQLVSSVEGTVRKCDRRAVLG